MKEKRAAPVAVMLIVMIYLLIPLAVSIVYSLFRKWTGVLPEGFRLEDGLWQREIQSEDEMPGLIAKVVEQGRSLYEARVIRPGLEEIYDAYLAGGRRREAMFHGETARTEPGGEAQAAVPGSEGGAG